MDKRKKPHSKEHKRKISETQKALGSNHWTRRPEVREKIRQSVLAKYRSGWVDPRKGVKRPQITGKNHYLWNGLTPLVEQVRKCIEYRQWRSDVFSRDDFTCQMCGERGGKLHADHIKQFAFIIVENEIKTMKQARECSELWNLNNGRTLCVPCHRTIPVYTYGGEREIVFSKSHLPSGNRTRNPVVGRVGSRTGRMNNEL